MTPRDFPEAFYIDVAVGVHSFEELCSMHGIPAHVVETLEDDPDFKRRLALAKQSVEDDGRAFRARCRTVINNSIGHISRLMRDPDTPASTQLDAFKTLAKFGELEPDKAAPAETGPQLTLNIIAPDGGTGMSLDLGSASQPEGRVIEHEPAEPKTQLPLMSAEEAAQWGA